MNRYAACLGDADPLVVIAHTPARIAELVSKWVPGAGERSLGPGKWTVREIISHLADCDLAFGFRLRQALAEPHFTVQPFDQDLWGARYAVYDLHSAMVAFSAFRNWNRRLIDSATPEDNARPVRHPEMGEMTFRTLVEIMAGHDLNHLAQFEKMDAAG